MNKNSKSEIRKAVEQKIQYVFKDPTFLYQSLTHSSYANEKNFPKHKDNERLEFLGDSVLELITSEYVYHEYEDFPEGDLTKLRASIVCEASLSSCAKELNIGQYLLLGKGEDITGGRQRSSILSDAIEAIIGAIYLDGGFTNAKEFIEKFILKDLDEKILFFDSKTILQEIIQNKKNIKRIKYKLISEQGPDHDKMFTVAVYIGNKKVGVGSGRTKKTAEQEAASQAIKKINKNNNTK